MTARGARCSGAEEAGTADRRVLLLLPTGRDASLAAGVLSRAGMQSEVCADFRDLAEELPRGAAAVLTAEEALRRMSPFFTALEDAPEWWTLPCVVLLARDGPKASSLLPLRALERNERILPSFVERPTSQAELLRALRAAVRVREAQYRCRDRIARLEGDVQRRDEFLAMLGHELRNPISSIAYVAEMFRQEGELAAETRFWGAGVVARQVRHLASLLDELLDVTRMSRGKLVLKLEPLDLRSVVEQGVETFRGAVASRRFERSLPEAPVPVLGDRVRLTQVVNNLLDNAFKYTERNGSIRVELAAAAGVAVLAVTDDGRGIGRDALQRIFEPFYQERVGRAGTKGFGLGLAMVQQIARLHGGTVAANSAGERKGARFELRLPLASRD